jgi:hypothetical protein
VYAARHGVLQNTRLSKYRKYKTRQNGN